MQSAVKIKNDPSLNLDEKAKYFSQFRRKCQQYQRMTYSALGDLYFIQQDYYQAKKYFAKSYQNNLGKTPLNNDEMTLKYALSLHFLNIQAAKVHDLFLEIRNKYHDQLPTNLFKLHKIYKISHAQQVVSKELILAALSSTKNYKNLAICPSINVSIHFDYDRATIRHESRRQINEILLALQSPNLSTMNYQYELVGHTDKRGKMDYNLQLSLRRANAVKQALIQLDEILSPQLIAMGKGESELELEGDTEQVHQVNRRVEVRVACD